MEWVRKWRKHLMIPIYNIDILYSDEENEAAAEITVHHDYMNAAITIYPPFHEEDDESQEKIILHELCHILTHKSKELAHQLHNGEHVTLSEINKANERLTSCIEKIIWKDEQTK